MRVCSFLCSDSLLYFFLFLSILYGVYTRDCSCIDKSMQILLERGFIDKPLTFNIGLLQASKVQNIYRMDWAINTNKVPLS